MTASSPHRTCNTLRPLAATSEHHLLKRRGIIAATVQIGAILFGRSNVRASGMATDGPKQGDQPEDFMYTHLWTSADGETHLKECYMKGFDVKSFAGDTPPQFVKEGSKPTKVTFSELTVDNLQDFHSCPGVQFVVCLSGSWFVETTDGDRKDFQPGEVLFQDDCEASPAKKAPKHKSGVNGDKPNRQMILSVDREPEVDQPGSLDKM